MLSSLRELLRASKKKQIVCVLPNTKPIFLLLINLMKLYVQSHNHFSVALNANSSFIDVELFACLFLVGINAH